MSGNNKKQEDIFNGLFESQGLEKAPDGFADGVMHAIEAEAAPEMSGRWSLEGWWLWGSLALGFAGLIAIVFMVDFSFMGSIFNGVELDGSRLSQFVSSMANGFQSMYEGFSASSLSITIIAAIVALFVIDRLFRRKPKVGVHLI
jgi:hypothetical protein